MTNQEVKCIEEIRSRYERKERSKFDELKALDKSVRRPADVFAYIFGGVGALVLGTGMCMAMKILGNFMALGIVIGIAGIAMLSSTYFLHKKILKARRNKYSKQIFELSDSLLHKGNM